MSFISTIGKAAASVMMGMPGVKQAVTERMLELSMPYGSYEFYKRHGKPPQVNRQALVKKYWGFVYMCCQISANKLASTPYHLYATRAVGESEVTRFSNKQVTGQRLSNIHKKFDSRNARVKAAEDVTEIEEHPLLDLLQNVNDVENSFETMELTQTMLDLTGDGYWYLQPNKLNVPDKLFVLRSQWVEIVPDKKTFVGGYWYGESFGDNRLRLESKDVVHFKYPNPYDPWYGLGPVQAAAYAIDSQEMREQFIIATMGNMARPDLFVKYTEGELTPEERRRLRDEWNNEFRGPKRAGKVMVTDYRWELDKIGWNPAELRFNEGERWIMIKICGAFPVPIGLVDTSEVSRAPRSGLEGSDLVMAQFNTLPRCRRMEEKINEQLTPRYDQRLFFEFDNPVPKDEARQLAEDNARLSTFVTTINEIRRREGMEEVEWGDVPLAPMGIAPLGSAPSMPYAGAGADSEQETSEAIGTQGEGGWPGGASEFVEGEKVHKDLAGLRLMRK